MGKKTNLLKGGLIVLAFLLVMAGPADGAGGYYWQVGTGNWSNDDNWDNGEPTYEEPAVINNGGMAQITEIGEECSSLILGSTGTSSGNVEMSSGSLMVNTMIGEDIGGNGRGTFTQTGGLNRIIQSLGNLYLGSVYGEGTYNLSGDGELVAPIENIGHFGTGTFNHSGGGNRVELMLNIGTLPGSDGTYNLSGTGELSVFRDEYIGKKGTGTFIQSGGTNTVEQTLYIGYEAGSVGTYGLGGGMLSAGTIEFGAGAGAFNFNAGRLSVGTFKGNLYNYGGTLAPGSSAGITTIKGNYEQQSTGVLEIELGGLSPGTHYDRLIVPGALTLNGTLDVVLINGFNPQVGNSFRILDFNPARFTGGFATINLPALPAGLFWDTTALYNTALYAMGEISVQPVTLTLLSPNGGETLIVGSTYSITWESQGPVSDVTIEYSTNNGSTWTQVDPPNTGNSGSYDWLVPAVASNQCLVRVSDAAYPEVFDTSDAVFTIRGPGGPMFVDADAPSGGTGTSWADAYIYLQDALVYSISGDLIYVAEGIYKPDQGAGQTADNQAATFQLKNGVAIYGGYAGFGAPDPDAHDIETYETILSGDLNDDDIKVDPCDLLYEPTRAENSYHVVMGSGTDETAILDGFSITAGNSNVFRGEDSGGGMYNDGSSPTVSNCTFSGNAALTGGGMYNRSGSSPTVTNCTFSGNAAANGGAMYNGSGSSPTVTNCTFTGNSAVGSGGAMVNSSLSSPTLTKCTFSSNSARNAGGGMYNGNYSTPTLTNCTFSANSADEGGGMHNLAASPTLTNCTFAGNLARIYGGGMFNDKSSPMVTNCTFSGNSAEYYGGGMYNREDSSPTVTNCTFSHNDALPGAGGGMANYQSSPTLTNCTFSGNSAEYYGGGIFNWDSSPTVTNCTFAGNSATNGNALACESYEHSYPSNVRVVNCILWDGGNEVWNNDGSTITINYSDVQDSWGGPGANNINIDPLFADPNGPDDIDGNEDDDLRLLPGSPCIDAGDNNEVPIDLITDLDNRLRFVDDLLTADTGNGGPPTVDMGAYEFACTGNLDDISDVTWPDFALLAEEWLCTSDCTADIDGDGDTDFDDLLIQTANWLCGTE